MNRRDDVWQCSFYLFSYLHCSFYSLVDCCIVRLLKVSWHPGKVPVVASTVQLHSSMSNDRCFSTNIHRFQRKYNVTVSDYAPSQRAVTELMIGL
jgi:hypothetical protein